MSGGTLQADDFNYIRQLVLDQSALTLDAGKEYLVESRLDPLARQEGFPSYLQMVKSLRTGPVGELHRRVVEAMANNETSFFRDARAFGMIARGILPALVAERSAARSLHIWCAACSTGQEPYSLAMLLRESQPALEGWDVRIIASDISRNVLARAREGCYTQFEVNRGLPAHLLVKYFEQHGTTWEIRPEIRGMVEFRDVNLIHPWVDIPTMHLILMRNVMIYLDLATKKAILERVGRLLDPRGYLLLGGAETTSNLDASFETTSIEGAVCFRRRIDLQRAAAVRATDAAPAVH
jgi:chemotaxis protein methyltransferase CheR